MYRSVASVLLKFMGTWPWDFIRGSWVPVQGCWNFLRENICWVWEKYLEFLRVSTTNIIVAVLYIELKHFQFGFESDFHWSFFTLPKCSFMAPIPVLRATRFLKIENSGLHVVLADQNTFESRSDVVITKRSRPQDFFKKWLNCRIFCESMRTLGNIEVYKFMLVFLNWFNCFNWFFLILIKLFGTLSPWPPILAINDNLWMYLIFIHQFFI